MTVGVLIISLLLAACAGAVAAGEGTRKVTLVMWSGHFTPEYWQLKESKSKQILFRKEVALLEEESAMSATDLLKKHVEDETLKGRLLFYRRGVVYRPGTNESPAEVIFNEGLVNKFQLSALQSNDIIVYLLWSNRILIAGPAHRAEPARGPLGTRRSTSRYCCSTFSFRKGMGRLSPLRNRGIMSA